LVVLSGLAFLVFSFLWACHAGLNTRLERRFMFGVFKFDLGHGTVRRAQVTVPRVVWGSTANGREDPTKLFGRLKAEKVASARFGSFPAAAFEIPAPDVPFSQDLGPREGEDLGTDEVAG
jgi:hypothetical protein